jgi:HEAT repeat protein
MARHDASINVSAAALRSLGTLGDPGQRPFLRSKLKEMSYRDIVSAGAVAGLAALRDPRELESLRRAASAPNGFWHRRQAIRSLCEYAAVSEKVVPWICGFAADGDERISLVAIGALGSLEDQRASAALEIAKISPNTRIRVYAEEALARVRLGIDSSPKKK